MHYHILSWSTMHGLGWTFNNHFLHNLTHTVFRLAGSMQNSQGVWLTLKVEM